MTHFDDEQKIRSLLERRKLLRQQVEETFIVDSLLEDYLFSRPRNWPQFEADLEAWLLLDEGLQREALKVIGRVQERFHGQARLRPDLPEGVHRILERRMTPPSNPPGLG